MNEEYVDVPMDETMIAATLIALEHTIDHCTRTRDSITAFVMARQKAQKEAAKAVDLTTDLHPQGYRPGDPHPGSTDNL